MSETVLLQMILTSAFSKVMKEAGLENDLNKALDIGYNIQPPLDWFKRQDDDTRVQIIRFSAAALMLVGQQLPDEGLHVIGVA